MKSSLLAFATDLHDEGLQTVLDNVKNRAGLNELTLAVAYHDARDLFPHNPIHKVRYLEGGVVFFQPEETRYSGLRIQPRVSQLARTTDPLSALCAAARDWGMRANAWAVFLHNDRLGFDHPECATQNAFGDRYFTDLCPANPDVRAYACALASDIARHGVSIIFAESLHFHGLEHGYHHERYFEELGAVGKYLLGLCFCGHCLEAARQAGVDAEMIHRSVREDLRRRFSGEDEKHVEELSRDYLESFGGEELLEYLDARARTVTSLVGEVSVATAAEGASLTFLDLSGAENNSQMGRPGSEATPNIGWRNGIDASTIAEACDAVAALGYTADTEQLNFDLDIYRALIPDASRLSLLLRPMPPDCRSADNLAAKVALAHEKGLGRVDFYHYGLSRLRALDWIRRSLAATGSR